MSLKQKELSLPKETSLRKAIRQKAKTLRGNELGWLIQLAENYLDSKTFQAYLRKYKLEPTRQFLNRLLADFHPNNFNVGNSNTEWFLIRKDIIDVMLNEATKEFEGLVKSCPLVPNITMLSIGERSKLLGEHSIHLDEWYHKLKRFLDGEKKEGKHGAKNK